MQYLSAIMKKIRLGVLGCSNFLRKRIIDAVRKSEYAEIISIASRDLDKAKKWAEEFNVPYFSDYNGLLEREDVDAVYISPRNLHERRTLNSPNYGLISRTS